MTPPIQLDPPPTKSDRAGTLLAGLLLIGAGAIAGALIGGIIVSMNQAEPVVSQATLVREWRVTVKAGDGDKSLVCREAR